MHLSCNLWPLNHVLPLGTGSSNIFKSLVVCYNAIFMSFSFYVYSFEHFLYQIIYLSISLVLSSLFFCWWKCVFPDLLSLAISILLGFYTASLTSCIILLLDITPFFRLEFLRSSNSKNSKKLVQNHQQIPTCCNMGVRWTPN